MSYKWRHEVSSMVQQNMENFAHTAAASVSPPKRARTEASHAKATEVELPQPASAGKVTALKVDKAGRTPLHKAAHTGGTVVIPTQAECTCAMLGLTAAMRAN